MVLIEEVVTETEGEDHQTETGIENQKTNSKIVCQKDLLFKMKNQMMMSMYLYL